MGRRKETTDEQIIIASRRCFLERGIGISVADIAKELGVSHTTLFNRFGSKEDLMIAALGPPPNVEWMTALEQGPDARPIRTQLVEHAQVIAAFFRGLHRGLGLLQAAGIDPARACERPSFEHSTPEQAFRLVVAWVRRAQEAGHLTDCDLEIVASTVLGSLHGHAFTAQIHGPESAPPASQEYVERFINVLWRGIGV